MNVEKIIKEKSNKILENKEVVAVLLFGSYARGEEFRDIDLCVVLDKKLPNIKMSRLKLAFASVLPSKFDIKIFQQLPVYVKIRILKEGKVIAVKDEDLLYEIAFQTIKEYEFYRKIYENYLAAMEND